MKYVANLQYIAGIKYLSPMAFHYSDAGGRQITTVSNLYGVDCRFSNFALFSNFIKRMSKVSDRTTPIVKAQVPFPVNDLLIGKVDKDSIFPMGLSLAQKQITYNYSTAAKTLPTNITSDVKLVSIEPNLRTRHLKSPRGERLILVNAGTTNINVKFIPPSGYSAWYDPSSGKHYKATPDENGYYSLELPFAGVMVLLTIPGKIAKAKRLTLKENIIPVNFSYLRKTKEIKASDNGLVEVEISNNNLEYFAGSILYEGKVIVPKDVTAKLELPNAKKTMLAIKINGKVEKRVWAPYTWNIPLQAGENTIQIELSTTPYKACMEPSYRQYLNDNKFDNVYLGYCDKFEELFPNEEPFKDAFIRF
jgi:hypothetical protein